MKMPLNFCEDKCGSVIMSCIFLSMLNDFVRILAQFLLRIKIQSSFTLKISMKFHFNGYVIFNF